MKGGPTQISFRGGNAATGVTSVVSTMKKEEMELKGKILALLLVAIMLTGCASTLTTTQRGALYGGAIGTTVGTIAGAAAGAPLVGLAVGGTVGALTGAVIGDVIENNRTPARKVQPTR